MDHLILFHGKWGCGIFGNDYVEMGRLWGEVLTTTGDGKVVNLFTKEFLYLILISRTKEKELL